MSTLGSRDTILLAAPFSEIVLNVQHFSGRERKRRGGGGGEMEEQEKEKVENKKSNPNDRSLFRYFFPLSAMTDPSFYVLSEQRHIPLFMCCQSNDRSQFYVLSEQ